MHYEQKLKNLFINLIHDPEVIGCLSPPEKNRFNVIRHRLNQGNKIEERIMRQCLEKYGNYEFQIV